MPDSQDTMAVRCAGEEWCPIPSTATLVGMKCHPVIVYRLLEGGPWGSTN